MQAVYSYSPSVAAAAASPAAATSAVATKAELAFQAIKQIVDAQIAAHCERLTRGARLAPGPSVKDIQLCQSGSSRTLQVIQVRIDQVMQYALNDIDTRIAALPASEKNAYNNILSELITKIQRNSGVKDILLICDPAANNNLFNSKLIKSIVLSAK